MKLEGHGGIQFWLNRVAEEEVINAIKLIKEAQVRNWQTINFESMHPSEQKKVLIALKEGMEALGWVNEAKEIEVAINEL